MKLPIPSLARFAGLAAATAAAVCAAAAWPVAAAEGPDALVALVAGVALALAGAVLGYLPLLARADADAVARAQAWLVGLGLRMFATLAALVAAWVAGVPHRVVLLLATAGAYVALLVLETSVVARSMRATAEGRA